MRTTIHRALNRWDGFLNGGTFTTAAGLFMIFAVFPAVVLTLVAQEAPIVGWLAISLALTVAVMIRRPRGG
jgi:hypothetical protein